MQKITIIGYLGADIKEITVAPNPAFNQIQVGCSSKTLEGEKTTWYRCNAQYVPEKLKPYLVKGTKILVHGDLKTSEYADKNGSKQFNLTVRVDYLQLVGSSEPKEQNATAQQQKKYTPPPLPDVSIKNEGSDDLPF